MIYLLLNISLDINIKVVETQSFQSNKGSPLGDSVSWIFFNIYLEDSL